jgi:hypothetical protein
MLRSSATTSVAGAAGAFGGLLSSVVLKAGRNRPGELAAIEFAAAPHHGRRDAPGLGKLDLEGLAVRKRRRGFKKHSGQREVVDHLHAAAGRQVAGKPQRAARRGATVSAALAVLDHLRKHDHDGSKLTHDG